jgi:dihydrofolate synthase/folylpolyglutamate synthase
MNFPEALQYLFGLGHESLALKLGLTNVERLLGRLASPQRAAPAVQIAGTNGKGSTAAMLDAICRVAGVRTGLYTSPHLVSITERIRLNGENISPAEFARVTTVVRDQSQILGREENIFPTFFEQVTAIALGAFRDARVQLMILETGLGGRLDATTAAEADYMAITPIDYDHQEYLGETLIEIAAEKAAIIRPGVQAVIAPQQPEAARVIEERLAACGVRARHVVSGEQIGPGDQTGRLRATFVTPEDRYENVRLNLRGGHQLINAALAVNIAEVLRAGNFLITREAIIAGLEQAEHPGRLEYQAGEPPLLLDGAHTPAGAAALANYLIDFGARPLCVIFAAMRDKKFAEMASLIFPLAETLILTRLADVRGAEPEDVRAAVESASTRQKIYVTASPAEAIDLARRLTPPHGLICVTGSLYLVGQVKQLLNGV